MTELQGEGAPTFTRRLATLAKFTAVFLAPFLALQFSWELALHYAPGRIAVADWQTFTACTFLAAGALAVFMVYRTRKPPAAKHTLAVLCLLASGYFAFMISLNSRCDSMVYIGEVVETVASCR